MFAVALFVLMYQEPAVLTTGLDLPGTWFVANQPAPLSGKRLLPDADVVAFLQSSNGRVLFTNAGAFLAMPRGDADQGYVVFQLGLPEVQASKRVVVPRLMEPTPTVFNYMVGPEEDWQTNLTTYRAVAYADAWPDVDLEYRLSKDGLMLKLHAARGAALERIQLATGASQLTAQANGWLISHDGAQLRLSHARLKQAGKRHNPSGSVSLTQRRQGQLGFALRDIDPNQPLVIEMRVAWDTYFGIPGGSGQDRGYDLTTDQDGNLYLLHSSSIVEPHDNLAENRTTYVSKLDNSFQEVWRVQMGNAPIAMDAGPNNQICFLTGSNTLRYYCLDTNGNQTTTGTVTNGSQYDAWDLAQAPNGDIFVTAYETTYGDPGTGLVWYRKYIMQFRDGELLKQVDLPIVEGGSLNQNAQVAVDAQGNVYVAGNAVFDDNSYATIGAYDTTADAGHDLFLTKFDGDLNRQWSSFLGGASNDLIRDLRIASDQTPIVLARAWANTFPTTPGTYTNPGQDLGNIAVTRFTADGTTILYSAVFGSPFTEQPEMLALDDQDNLFVTGDTLSTGFPTTPGAAQETGTPDTLGVFVVSLDANAQTLRYGTYLNTSGEDALRGITIQNGDAVVTGRTSGHDFPTTPGAPNPNPIGGSHDATITKLDHQGAIMTATYWGTGGAETIKSMTLDGSDNIYLSGRVGSALFPTTAGSYDDSFNANWDGFVTKINPSGSQILSSTFIGGVGGEDEISSIGIDGTGTLYLGGTTESADFPGGPPVNVNPISTFLLTLDNQLATLLSTRFVQEADAPRFAGIRVNQQGDVMLRMVDDQWALYKPNGADITRYASIFNTNMRVLAFSETGDTVVRSTVGNQYIYRKIAYDGTFLYQKAVNGFPQETMGGPGEVSEVLYNNTQQYLITLDDAGNLVSVRALAAPAELPRFLGVTVDQDRIILTGIANDHEQDFLIAGGSPHSGGEDGYLAIFDMDLNPVFATYFGGSQDDSLQTALYNSQDALILRGRTESDDLLTAPSGLGNTLSSASEYYLAQIFPCPATVSQSESQNFCAGETITLTAAFGFDSYQWQKDGIDIPGETGQELMIVDAEIEDAGLYRCVTMCSTRQWTGALVQLGLHSEVALTPQSQAVGLTPVVISAQVNCIQTNTIDWALNPTAPFTNGGDHITIDPPPSQTTTVTMTLTDTTSTQWIREAILLYPASPALIDYNNDGCNNIQDLYALLPNWNTAFEGDATGDAFLDITDLLYINTANEGPGCTDP